jgi:hypothetical protein
MLIYNPFILLYQNVDTIFSNINNYLIIYFLLFLRSSSPVILLDLGHLTFKGGKINLQNIEEDIFYNVKVFF